MTNFNRTFEYDHNVEHLTLMLNNAIMHNGSDIIDYNNYTQFTILPPLFHQIWIKAVGGRVLPQSQINSCRIMHSNSNAILIGNEIYKVKWQHKLWNTTDLEEFFMFNSTSNKPLVFSNSAAD